MGQIGQTCFNRNADEREGEHPKGKIFFPARSYRTVKDLSLREWISARAQIFEQLRTGSQSRGKK